MSAAPITLPPIPRPIPSLPTQGATHDQQMAHHAARMREWEAEVAELRFAQAERSIQAITAQADANRALVTVATEANRLQGLLLTEGAKVNGDDIIAAIDRLVAAIGSAPVAPGGQTGDVDRLVALVSTMTSAERRNPAAAAAAAAAQLAAIRG